MCLSALLHVHVSKSANAYRQFFTNENFPTKSAQVCLAQIRCMSYLMYKIKHQIAENEENLFFGEKNAPRCQ